MFRMRSKSAKSMSTDSLAAPKPFSRAGTIVINAGSQRIGSIDDLIHDDYDDYEEEAPEEDTGLRCDRIIIRPVNIFRETGYHCEPGGFIEAKLLDVEEERDEEGHRIRKQTERLEPGDTEWSKEIVIDMDDIVSYKELHVWYIVEYEVDEDEFRKKKQKSSNQQGKKKTMIAERTMGKAVISLRDLTPMCPNDGWFELGQGFGANWKPFLNFWLRLRITLTVSEKLHAETIGHFDRIYESVRAAEDDNIAKALQLHRLTLKRDELLEKKRKILAEKGEGGEDAGAESGHAATPAH